MIYTKKAFFLFAIACAGTLAAITPDEREALLAEAAEKQTLLRDLVEKIFAQDARMRGCIEKASAKVKDIARIEEQTFGIPAAEIYEKTTQEIKDFCNVLLIEKPITISESFSRESGSLNSRSLIKLYILQAGLYEHLILFNLIKEWEEVANSLNQILIKLDSGK